MLTPEPNSASYEAIVNAIGDGGKEHVTEAHKDGDGCVVEIRGIVGESVPQATTQDR